MATLVLKEDKQKLFDKVCEEIKTTLRPINEICAKYGTYYTTMASFAAASKDNMDVWTGAKNARGWAWSNEAINVLKDCEVFYQSANGKRDSSAIVAKAKGLSDAYFRHAVAIDPAVWGDLRYELKHLQKDVDQMKLMMEATLKMKVANG